jgi:hypothetical protein
MGEQGGEPPAQRGLLWSCYSGLPGRGGCGPVQEFGAFLGGRAAPYAVGFANGECPRQAVLNDGAGGADALGGVLALAAMEPALAVWVEEDVRRDPATGSRELPIPVLGVRCGQS